MLWLAGETSPERDSLLKVSHVTVCTSFSAQYIFPPNSYPSSLHRYRSPHLLLRLAIIVYPWASQPANTTICDIAGGNGHVTMGLLKAHPHLKLVLQDQPQVIDMAKKVPVVFLLDVVFFVELATCGRPTCFVSLTVTLTGTDLTPRPICSSGQKNMHLRWRNSVLNSHRSTFSRMLRSRDVISIIFDLSCMWFLVRIAPDPPRPDVAVQS